MEWSGRAADGDRRQAVEWTRAIGGEGGPHPPTARLRIALLTCQPGRPPLPPRAPPTVRAPASSAPRTLVEASPFPVPSPHTLSAIAAPSRAPPVASHLSSAAATPHPSLARAPARVPTATVVSPVSSPPRVGTMQYRAAPGAPGPRCPVLPPSSQPFARAAPCPFSVLASRHSPPYAPALASAAPPCRAPSRLLETPSPRPSPLLVP